MHGYYIAMARSKGGCSNLKGIVRKFFNATQEIRVFLIPRSLSVFDAGVRNRYHCIQNIIENA